MSSGSYMLLLKWRNPLVVTAWFFIWQDVISLSVYHRSVGSFLHQISSVCNRVGSLQVAQWLSTLYVDLIHLAHPPFPEKVQVCIFQRYFSVPVVYCGYIGVSCQCNIPRLSPRTFRSWPWLLVWLKDNQLLSEIKFLKTVSRLAGDQY